MKSFKQFFLENIEEQLNEVKHYLVGITGNNLTGHTSNPHFSSYEDAISYKKKFKHVPAINKAKIVKGTSDKHGFVTPVNEEVELDENIGGLFKGASEWESSAKARGLVVKPATHPSGEATKYQIAKDKEGNNRGHFDHGTKTGKLKEEVEQLDELSPKTLRSYSDKANKSLDRLAKQRDAIEKSMHKTYAAVDKRNSAEKAAYGATTQAQHNKATAAYRAANKSAKKNLAGHNDLTKQHIQLTKKINRRMDGMDRAYDKMHEEVNLDEAKLERNVNTVGAHHLERDSGEHKMYTRYYGSLKRREHTVTDKDDNILGQGLSAASAMAKAKLKKAHRDALMHDDNQIVKVHDTRGGQNVGTQVATPGKGKWFKDHEEALKYAKSLPGKIRHADEKGHVH